jgi:hypothetical protein
MAITIPIISEFNGKGIQKAIKQFKQLETNGQRAMFVLKNGAKAAAAGFLAIGAAAGAAAVVGYQFAKMAIEDQRSQRQLAQALRASTKATDEDIKTREKWIDTTARALGVADDELRPSYARIVRSTKDADKAQRLLNLALNISAATSKPLSTVVNSLARAYDGNFMSLGKLGLGLDKATLKGKDFAKIQKTLETNFGGAAAAQADTYEGRVARLKVTFDELKESLGAKLLPVFDQIAQAIMRITDAFGDKGMRGAVKQLQTELSFLFYNADGSLNGFSESLNKLITVMNAFAGGGKLLGGIGNLLFFGKKGNLQQGLGQFGEFGRGEFGLAGISPTTQQGMGKNLIGTARYGQAQGITVNIQMGYGDPVAVGRNVANVLRQYDRRTGGR